MILKQQQFFSPYAFYVRIAVIATYATLLWESAFDNRTATDNDHGTFPCGRTRCNTCVHNNVSPSIVTPGGHITVQFKCTCVRENMVYEIKCHTCNKAYIGKTGRRLADRLIRSTRLPDTDLSVGRHFTSPGHRVGDMLVSLIRFGFRSATERRSLEARMIFRTSRAECALQLYLNFSKSARAWNVSLDFYLNVTLRLLFWVALKHWGRGSTLETFFVPFQRTHF